MLAVGMFLGQAQRNMSPSPSHRCCPGPTSPAGSVDGSGLDAAKFRITNPKAWRRADRAPSLCDIGQVRLSILCRAGEGCGECMIAFGLPSKGICEEHRRATPLGTSRQSARRPGLSPRAYCVLMHKAPLAPNKSTSVDTGGTAFVRTYRTHVPCVSCGGRGPMVVSEACAL